MAQPPRKRSVFPQRSELAAALASCRGAFVVTGLISAMSNVLMLTGAMFMLQIYDRVLPSRSVPTLVGLAALAAGLYVAQGLLDLIRGRILARIGLALDERLNERVYHTIVRLPSIIGLRNEGTGPMRDLDSVRTFLGSAGPVALFDLPWMPVYLGICFAFHFLIGITAVIGGFILVMLTLLTEWLAHNPTMQAARLGTARTQLLESSRRNAEALVAMGMVGNVIGRWNAVNADYLASNRRASDVAGGLGAISKVLRLMLQSAVLGVGAYLVIYQEASAGIIIAGSSLAARALAPVDIAIAHWRGWLAARQSWGRLRSLLGTIPEDVEPMELDPPHLMLVVENVNVVPPGAEKQVVVVRDLSLKLHRGSGLGVIGPSASGKSSLARVLVGYWTPRQGKVCLDGAALDQWAPHMLGRYIGYLPQHVELLSGTVAQNISRFEPNADAKAIREAAAAAGVHEMIVSLPDGYDTQIGEHSGVLSAGQAQRIALARALYHDPFLVVLDEPNSNLDAEGEAALTKAILGIRARGGIAVVIAHRPSAIAGVDLLLAMKEGRAVAFGPKDEVIAKVLHREPTPRPLKIVPEAGSA